MTGQESLLAALFVERDGVYYGLETVDPWDEERDARLYAGPYPVVAHPPCNKWSPLAYINQRRIPGYRLGDDGGCFEAALKAVRTFGGVLEHPANSVAWKHYGLMKPERGFWKGHFGEWVTEVDQGSYGHRARKRTWLYATGMPSVPPALDWEVAESDAIVSGFTHQPKGAHVACEHRRIRPREASRTPIAFRDLLIGIALSARSPIDDRRPRTLAQNRVIFGPSLGYEPTAVLSGSLIPARFKRWGRMARGLAGFGGYRRRMYLYALICDLPYPLWRRSATLRRFAGKP